MGCCCGKQLGNMLNEEKNTEAIVPAHTKSAPPRLQHPPCDQQQREEQPAAPLPPTNEDFKSYKSLQPLAQPRVDLDPEAQCFYNRRYLSELRNPSICPSKYQQTQGDELSHGQPSAYPSIDEFS